MQSEATPTFFLQILLLLGVATVLITLFHRLRITPLLAFIVTGMLFGPTGLGVVEDPGDLSAVATLGLSFLLFLLGLEFSLPRLIALRDTVFKLGAAQVFFCTAAFAVPLYGWGLPLPASVLLAAGMSLSSTAIVSRELSKVGQLHARHGEIAIGVLLFQDLVAVALLIAVPLLAGQRETADPVSLLLSLLQTVLLLLVFYVVAQYLLPRILREVSRHQSDELLVLAALVIVLLCATLTSQIGLSMELGAFLAGMMLGESRFRHQLEADIRPFRDLLLGLFFITIGMLIDLELLREYWLRIFVSGVVFLAFKAGIIALVARVLGETWRAALPAGMAIAQGGEFLFVLMALATRESLVPGDVASFLISVTIVTMTLTPLLIRHGPRLVDLAILRYSKEVLSNRHDLEDWPVQHREDHVVILGFGRVGQSVARFFKPLGIDYLVLESDTVRVAECAAAGEPIFYGNAVRRGILKAAGVDKASLIIISFDNLADSRKILEVIREINPDIPVLAHTRDDSHLDQLMALGATEVIPETHEASLTLASHALLMLNIPAQKVEDLISSARRNRYRMLQGFYHGEKMNLTLRKDRHSNALHAVVLTGAAWACHKRVGNLHLPENLQLWELHRQQKIYQDDELADLVLQNGDVAILKGALEVMPLGEAYLLRG